MHKRRSPPPVLLPMCGFYTGLIQDPARRTKAWLMLNEAMLHRTLEHPIQTNQKPTNGTQLLLEDTASGPSADAKSLDLKPGATKPKRSSLP